MNKSRSIDGRWWLFGEDQPAHFGTLAFDPETEVKLTVKIPQTLSDDNFLRALDEDTDKRPRIVNGADEHGTPITLFGCSWLNQKTLAQRLTEIFQRHSTETARLTAGIDDFPAKVRHTRNYYTHYTEDLRTSGKVAEGDELIRITFAVEDLLKICLLKEIGIHGKPIDRLLERGFPVHVITLQSTNEAKA